MKCHPNLLERLEFDAATLVARHPPRFSIPHKRLVYAMACPAERPHAGHIHYSRYRREEIVEALTAAYTGFSAARLESSRLHGQDAGVIVHTGFWGCGAFGGNRVLMPYLQIMAAGLAGLKRLVFHTFNAAGSRSLDHAIALGDEIRTLLPDPSAHAVVDVVHRRGFQWGVSDGN